MRWPLTTPKLAKEATMPKSKAKKSEADERMPLNEGQETVRQAVLKHFRAKRVNNQFLVLRGGAGTGKTTTLCRVLERLAKAKNVWLCAPTHKAVRVMRAMAPTNVKCTLNFATAQSMLGLKMVKRNGKRYLIKPKKSKCKLRSGDIVILDEGSMAQENLVKFLEEEIARLTTIRCLVVGDTAQLPPVDEIKSRSFSLGPNHVLTKVERQPGGSPVLDLCTAVRECVEGKRDQLPEFIEDFVKDKKIGVHTKVAGAWDAWALKKFELGGPFDTDPDHCRIAAWTNNECKRLNRLIRTRRYPDDPAPFSVGEIVVFREVVTSAAIVGASSVLDDDQVLVQNQSEGIIEGIEERKHPDYEFKAWAATVKLREEAARHSVFVLDPSSVREYNQAIDALKEAQEWEEFYTLNDSYADMRSAYAQTAHGLQGTTVKNCFIQTQDILRNPNRMEALQCLYVALTRATDNVVVRMAA